MTQQLLHVVGAGDQDGLTAARLRADGFEVGKSGRGVGGIMVRVRPETDDETRVRSIVADVAPSATYGPTGSAYRDLVGYREGR